MAIEANRISNICFYRVFWTKTLYTLRTNATEHFAKKWLPLFRKKMQQDQNREWLPERLSAAIKTNPSRGISLVWQ